MTSQGMQASQVLRMKVQLAVIDHLGMKMYTTLPPVISELIANCWDADAEHVWVTISKDSHSPKISVKDDGTGMSFEELNDAFLLVGRNRRVAEGTEITRKHRRKVMGRKGIGKLAAFGIARIIEVESTKDNITTKFRMDLDDIKEVVDDEFYEPEILINQRRLGRKEGTILTLKKLNRKRAINIDVIRRKIARRFSVIGNEWKFAVSVNGKPITPKDRDLKKKVQYYWEVVPKARGDRKPNDKACVRFIDGIIKRDSEVDWSLYGWIGTMENPIDDTGDMGIVLMARGKLIHEPSFFEVTGGKEYAYAYMLGEIHADFFDEEDDLIATHRGSVVWESEPGSLLKKWLQDNLRKIAAEWSDKRAEKKEKAIREEPVTAKWLEKLSPPERKTANKIIKTIARSEKLDAERQKELMQYARDSFEVQVFRDLVNELGNDPDDAKLLELFEEWRVIEAREVLRIAEGRIESIEHFDKLVKKNAKEVPDLHKYLAEFPWILDPTWTKVEDEVHYSELLRKHFPNEELDEKNRRIDFVCLGAGDTVHVVEMKRPKHKLNGDNLEQISRYVDFVRGRLGNVPNRSYSSAAGYILVGEIGSDPSLTSAKNRLAADRIYVMKYEDLLKNARKLHKEFAEKLRKYDPTWNEV